MYSYRLEMYLRNLNNYDSFFGKSRHIGTTLNTSGNFHCIFIRYSDPINNFRCSLFCSGKSLMRRMEIVAYFSSQIIRKLQTRQGCPRMSELCRFVNFFHVNNPSMIYFSVLYLRLRSSASRRPLSCMQLCNN